MKKVPLAFAIILWIVGIVLLTLMWSLNAPPEVRIDLSDIETRQVVAGTNIIEIDFERSYNAFVQQSNEFDLVLVGFRNKYKPSKLTYIGIEDGQWYRAERQIEEWLGWLPQAREVEIVDRQMTISYGKDKLAAGLLTFIIVIGAGGLGMLCFSIARDY